MMRVTFWGSNLSIGCLEKTLNSLSSGRLILLHGPYPGPLSPPPSKEKVQDRVKLSPWSAIAGRSTGQKAFVALTSSHWLAFSWTSPSPHDPRSYKLVMSFHHSSIPLDLLHQPLFAPSHHLKNFLKNDIEASNARFCSYKFVEKQKKSLASKNLTSTYITFVCNLVPDHEKASLCVGRFTHLLLSLVFLLVFQLWAKTMRRRHYA